MAYQNRVDAEEKRYSTNIPGRIRVKIDSLYGNQILCKKISKALLKTPGIMQADANAYTASLLVVYNHTAITQQRINLIIEEVLHPGKAPSGMRSNVVKANFVFNKALSAKELAQSKDVLSNECFDFNLRTLQRRSAMPSENNLWYDLSAAQTQAQFNTDISCGLTKEEADRRLKAYGFNAMQQEKRKSLISMFFYQFDGFIVKLLLGASGLSFFMGHIMDSISILVIILVEAAIGVWQEYKAQKSIDSLKSLTAPSASVIRSGERVDLPAERLVAGDILQLEAGDMVPADARIVESHGLEVVESALTGEAFSVYKNTVDIPAKGVTLGDRSNMLYMGTSVVKGNAKAIVVATGMQTEMGRIASMLGAAKKEETPLQQDLNRLAKFITWGCVGICALITVTGILCGNPLMEMFATGISLAVGAIPEGLATILAIALAFGSQRMAKKNAIVKTLPALETLSCTRVICTDKTGTLTQNRMTMTSIRTMDKSIEISGTGYRRDGCFTCDGQAIDAGSYLDAKQLLTAAALCNNAKLIPADEGEFEFKGDPTEAAMLIAVRKSGICMDHFDCYTRNHEIPFDPDSKKMIAICSDQNGESHAYIKGAMDAVLKCCSKVMVGDAIVDLTQHLDRLSGMNDQMASGALRVLALAYKPLKTKNASNLDRGAIFLGLAGIIDPLRPDIEKSIESCHKAGIKVVMITGDHKYTATAIAKSCGLLTDNGIVLSSEELDAMSDEQLDNIIDHVQVFARSCPEQKLRIVKAFKKRGYIVAMTGDGVNDAPALKEAHVGIAMGQGGTDVAKDASSIILADDNFKTIVKAVEEGRTVNRNVKKFLRYVLTGNLAEVLAILIATLLQLPSPLIPGQILMINLVTEGIPALSLGVDPPDENAMREPPRDPQKSVFDRELKTRIISRGISTGLTTLALYAGTLFLTGNVVIARTMAFANLVVGQMLHAFECSSKGLKRNKYLLPSVGISTGILLASIYIPSLAKVLGMAALGLPHWAAILLSAAVLGRIGDFIHDVLFAVRKCFRIGQPRLSPAGC